MTDEDLKNKDGREGVGEKAFYPRFWRLLAVSLAVSSTLMLLYFRLSKHVADLCYVLAIIINLAVTPILAGQLAQKTKSNVPTAVILAYAVGGVWFMTAFQIVLRVLGIRIG